MWTEALTVGTLASMTDPIEVIEKLEKVHAPHTFITTIEMESLLNDATGILMFFTFMKMSMHEPPIEVDIYYVCVDMIII